MTKQSEQTFLENLVPQWAEMTRRLDLVHRELVSIKGVHRTGAEPRPLIGTASMKLASSPGQLAGFALHETSSTASAFVRIRDGLGPNGGLILPIALAAGESTRDWFLPSGIAFTDGLYVEIVSGAVEGCLFVGPVPQ